METREEIKKLGIKLQVWDKLELIIEDRKRQGRYLARVQDITDKYVEIDSPLLLSGDRLFPTDSRFTAMFIRPDSIYSFRTQVIGKIQGSIETYQLRPPTKLERNQRRKYFRIDVSTEVTLLFADPILNDSKAGGDNKEYTGSVANFSANGLLVGTEMNCKIGDKLLLSVNVSDLGISINSLGIVRRKEKDDGKFKYGIEYFLREELHLLLSHTEIERLPKKYLRIDEKQRTKIVNAVFDRQLEFRQRGLL